MHWDKHQFALWCCLLSALTLPPGQSPVCSLHLVNVFRIWTRKLTKSKEICTSLAGLSHTKNVALIYDNIFVFAVAVCLSCCCCYFCFTTDRVKINNLSIYYYFIIFLVFLQYITNFFLFFLLQLSPKPFCLLCIFSF